MSKVAAAAAKSPTYHGAEKVTFDDTVAPNPEPLTGREKMEAEFPHIIAITRDEDALSVVRSGMVDAEQDALARNQIETADNEIEALRNEQHPKPSKAVAEKCEKRRTALKAERNDIVANAERQRAMTPGSMKNYLKDFFNSSAVYGKFKHADTSAEINEGESVADAMKRMHVAWHEQRALKQTIIKAPLPAAEIALNAHDFVRRNAVPLEQTVGSLRRVRFVEGRGFSPRNASAPKDNSGNVDALGLMCAVLGEQIAAALAAKALDGHDESKALDNETRNEIMRAVDAEILRIEYQAAAIHRLSRKRGENAGPRLGSNPLCILDLLPA